MNLSAIYSKTGKGARALATKSKNLSANAMRILPYIDGKTSAEAILPQLGKLPEDKFTEALSRLIHDGLIKEVNGDYLIQSLSDFEIHTPIMVAEISAEEFMQIESAADGANNDIRIREQAEAEARARAYADAQHKLQEEALKQEAAERRLLNVTDILAKSSDSLDIERLASQEPRQSKTNAEARAKHKARKRVAEQARRESQQAEALANAEKSRIAADEQTMKEQARQSLREHAEHKAKAALEAEQVALEVRLAAAAKARREEERREHEAETNARLEAKRLAQEAKLLAQQEAKALAEAQALQQAELRARQAAEKQARIEADKQAKAERRALQETRAQTERAARQKLKAEQLLQLEAEAKLRAIAQAQVKHEAEERARIAAETKAMEKARRIERAQAEKALKAAAKRQAKQQSTAQAQIKAQEKAQLRQARLPTDHFPWLSRSSAVAKKSLLSVVVIILLALMLLPLVNLGFLTDTTQSRLAKAIGEPVAIQTVRVSLWPQPHLTLNGVSIGNSADIKAESVKLYPVFSNLLAGSRVLRAIEVEAISLDENNAQRPFTWIKNATTLAHVKLEHITFNKVNVTWQGLTLPLFDTDIAFNTKGAVRNALLITEDGQLRIEATPANNSLMLDIAADNWQFPLGPPVVFDKMKAKGLLSDKRLQFDQIEGHLYNGTIKATMSMQWEDQWSGYGKFALTHVDLAQITPIFTSNVGLEGKLAANGVFSLHADTLHQLFEAPSITAYFDSAMGAIKGIDLIRAIQAGSRNAIIGTTPYERLSGHLRLKNQHYQFSDLMLKTKQIQAQGKVDVLANQDISGKIDVQLATSSRQLESRILLSGKLAHPSLK